jgi:hypothetical protein
MMPEENQNQGKSSNPSGAGGNLGDSNPPKGQGGGRPFANVRNTPPPDFPGPSNDLPSSQNPPNSQAPPASQDLPSSQDPLAPPEKDVLPDATMPADISKGEVDKDMTATRPEQMIGAKPPDVAFDATPSSTPTPSLPKDIPPPPKMASRIDESEEESEIPSKPKETPKPQETSKPKETPKLRGFAKPPETVKPIQPDGEPIEGEIVEKPQKSQKPQDSSQKEEPQKEEPEAQDHLPEKPDVKEELKSAIGNMGISLKTCFSFLLMICLIGAVIYYFVFYRPDIKEDPPTPDDEITEDEDSGQGQDPDLDQMKIMDDFGINSALKYGLYATTSDSINSSTDFGDTSPDTKVFYSGVDASLIFGGIKTYPLIDFVKYVRALEELRNVYNTDIHSMLDASPSRLTTLENHIKVFEDSIANAEERFDEMVTQMNEIKFLYDQSTLNKEEFEQKFFAAVDDLQPNATHNFLEQFIIKYKEQIDFKSRYNAMVKLHEFYESALKHARARLTDIKANIDPLVMGVSVVDIVGSRIDLISPASTDL